MNPWESPLYSGNPFLWVKAGMQPEGLGRYNTLFDQQEQPGGMFEGMDITQMTVDELIDFADPQGDYGQWVAANREKERRGEVSTPLGYYQIVGSTLGQLKEDLGLRGDEKFTPELQDTLGLSLANKRGLNKLITGEIPLSKFQENMRAEWPGWEMQIPPMQADMPPIPRPRPTRDHPALADRPEPLMPDMPPVPRQRPQGLLPAVAQPAARAAATTPQPPATPSMWAKDRNPPGSLLGRMLGGKADTRDKNDFRQYAAAISEGLSAISGRRPVNPKVVAPFQAKAATNRTADWLEQNGMGMFAEAIRNGQMTAAQAFTLLQKNKMNPTAAMQNYLAAAKDPGFMDYLVKMAQAGKIDIDFGERGFDKDWGALRAKRLGKIMDAGDTARGKMMEMRFLRDALQNADDGTFAALRSQMTVLADDLGLPISEEVRNKADATVFAQTFINKMALSMRSTAGGEGMPGAMSDRDLAFLVKTVPNISNRREANALIIEAQLLLLQRQQDYANQALRLASEGITPGDPRFNERMEAHFAGDPSKNMYDMLIERVRDEWGIDTDTGTATTPALDPERDFVEGELG